MTSANRLAVLGCAVLVATTAAGCASATKAVTGGDSNGPITMGTVNVTKVLDPAGTYETGSWLVLNNTFQSLLKFPSGASSPKPDAAQSCSFTGADAITYQCTMRSGLKFSNGHPLTNEDVVFSIQRLLKINDPSGAASLLSTIKSVEAKGDSEVVFHLNAPDAVLPAKLASAAGSIVDHQVFPADKLLPNDKLVGSGPYKIDSIEDLAGSDSHAIGKVTLSANSQYGGDAKLQNNKFVVRYFDKPEDLKAALDKHDIDLADNNSLDPASAAKLKDDQLAGKSDFKVAEGDSGETRFLVFNTKDATGGNQAVRQAVAQLLDRKALARDVYAQTVQPLYSIIPAGITGHNTAFFDKYGDPDVAKAKKKLSDAKVQLPVPIKLNIASSRSRAGTGEVDAIKKQLEDGGLFQVTLQHESDFTKYQEGWKSGAYQAYLVSWTSDYPDPDDFVSPLLLDGGVFHNSWDDPKISQKLVPEGLKQTDRTAGGDYAQIQNMVADAAPVVPLFQSKAFYVSRNNITGVENTVDTSGVFRFWEIGRIKK
ncbi:ABC transporter substrate-binding protein [Kitasatospora sp. GP82]|uniref:ABC transporter substrate-binding protein n=1 Tax=Kitasatospora sp. GP82 TaxID=3035089 RepID=UPI002475D745|nr:ABC transporter substrate-binding protein [Kitasatospora sp. GP82]MDH6127094.1 peptide/nickel transport system substrate-binding protein [Kitasatospora sp. GP82]